MIFRLFTAVYHTDDNDWIAAYFKAKPGTICSEHSTKRHQMGLRLLHMLRGMKP